MVEETVFPLRLTLLGIQIIRSGNSVGEFTFGEPTFIMGIVQYRLHLTVHVLAIDYGYQGEEIRRCIEDRTLRAYRR